MHSLAGEHLQELDNLVGEERQKQENIIKDVMGTLYQGERHYMRESGTWHLENLVSAGFETVRVFRYYLIFLADSYNRDCILDYLSLSGSSPFPTGAKTSASRT